MTSDSIAAPIPCCQYFDPSKGVLVLVPQFQEGQLVPDENGCIVLKLVPLSVQRKRADASWLTVTQAARLHMQDVDGLTLEQAKARVSRAADRGRFIAEGRGHDRRIDPGSFAQWRLEKREENLDSDDDGDGY